MPCASCDPRHFSLATTCPKGTCTGPAPSARFLSMAAWMQREMQDGTRAGCPEHGPHATRSRSLLAGAGLRCSPIICQSLRARRLLSWKPRPSLSSPAWPLIPQLPPPRLRGAVLRLARPLPLGASDRLWRQRSTSPLANKRTDSAYSFRPGGDLSGTRWLPRAMGMKYPWL